MGFYTITEPQPTVAQGSSYHCGRGGAGNYQHVTESITPASSVVTHMRTTNLSTTSPTSSPYPSPSERFFFHSGRGGAGNAHVATETPPPPLMSLDEEVARALRREESALVGHVGRGGAGNCYRRATKIVNEDDEKMLERVHSPSSTRSSSAYGGSNHSTRGLLSRFSSN